MSQRHSMHPLRLALALCAGVLIGHHFSDRVTLRGAATVPGAGEEERIDEPASVADPGASQLAQERIEALRAFGYLGTAEGLLERTGVVHREPERVQSGLGLYNPAHAAEAYLIDLEGEVLHRWALPIEQAFPDGPAPSPSNRYWRRVRLLDDGGLLAIYEGVGLVRIDRDSRLVWARANGAHHDLDWTPEGQLAVIRRQAHVNPKIHPSEPVLEDFIEILDPESGEALASFSIFDAFARSPHASALIARPAAGDVFHTNTLQVLDDRHAHDVPAFARGNYLVSLRELSLVAVIDAARREVVWSMAGQWARQHEPQLLPNGRLLIFDNSGHGAWSKVIEIDPRTQAIHWAFYGTPENDFYSETMGSQQRLANGNTLITESNAGRVREVTPDGREVWRFHSPHRLEASDADGSVRTARICEMQRVDAPAAFSIARK